ncbi:MAG: hypothetical protein ABIX01_09175 [Chitinophagaceae bacterium]
MYTTYHLESAQDITIDILETIKENFKSKPISISVTEELDATAYLVSTPANQRMLDASLEQAKKGDLVEIKITD